MRAYPAYASYRKPSWAPPAWVFAPVWSVLYLLIAASFGYVFYEYFAGVLAPAILAPFALNLLFNLAYTPLQFKLKSFMLASLDVLLVLATLAWALITIYPLIPWVAYLNLPYLAWVSFASILQLAVTSLNARR